jgi:hypothetical protein
MVRAGGTRSLAAIREQGAEKEEKRAMAWGDGKLGSLAEALVLQAMTVRRFCDGLWTALFHSSGLSLFRWHLSLMPVSDRCRQSAFVWLWTVALNPSFFSHPSWPPEPTTPRQCKWQVGSDVTLAPLFRRSWR